MGDWRRLGSLFFSSGPSLLGNSTFGSFKLLSRRTFRSFTIGYFFTCLLSSRL